MTITDIVFIMVFLPVVLVLYHISNENIKKYIIGLASIVFYACGSAGYVLLLLASITINYFLAKIVMSVKEKKKNLALTLMWVSILYNVAVLILYKYCYMWIFKQEEVTSWLLPLGISYFTFKSISFVVDVYLEKIEKINAIDVLVYLSFFAQITQGPLSRYDELRTTFSIKTDEGKQMFMNGLIRFSIGFSKKILVANLLGNVTREVFAMDTTQRSSMIAWLGAICYALQLYYDFSGYSDMAIGMTNMFGLSCTENFNYPFAANSFADFWRRWHISLGTWFRDYVMYPIMRLKTFRNLSKNLKKKMGKKAAKLIPTIMAMFVVWLLTGLWHGITANFIFWGLSYFAMISFEDICNIPKCFKSIIGKLGYQVWVLFITILDFVIFNSTGLKSGLQYIRDMFFRGQIYLADARAIFWMKELGGVIVLAIVFAFPVIPKVTSLIEKNKVCYCVVRGAYIVVCLALFVVAISLVVAGQNNPFVYANF